MISEVINGVLVFGPDDMTEEEYLAWRTKMVAETDLYWEELRTVARNVGGKRRIMDKVSDWLRFVRNRLRWI